MPADTAQTGWLSRLKSALGPRGGLVLLVAAHFVLTVLQSWPLPYQVEQRAGTSLFGLPAVLRAASEAIVLSQLTLIAAYVTLGGGRWFLRLGRGALLVLWFVLAHMAGSHWLDSGRDSRGFEAFLAVYVLMFGFLALPMGLYQLAVRRRISLVNEVTTERRLQFRIVHLLLVTTEVAAVMGAIRALVAWNREWYIELWNDLMISWQIASYDFIALSVLAIVPAVLLSVRMRSLSRAAWVLAIWELPLSVGFVGYRFLLPDLDPQFPIISPEVPGWIWALDWLNLASFCLTAALVVWLTLAIVRWLGYDFLPLPRRGGGRQSSEATSAA